MNQLLLLLIGVSFVILGCKPDSLNTSESNTIGLPEYGYLDTTSIQSNATKNRYAWQKPELVIDRMGDLDGKVVADIGAGTGYFTFRLYRKAEKVIATEIDTHMIHIIELFKANLDESEQVKIETRIDNHDSPNLEKNEVDIALIINTVGYLQDKSYYLTKLHESLSEDGELMVVDFKSIEIPDDIAPKKEYRMDALELEHLLERIGYSSVVVDFRSLQYQYIIKANKH